MCRADAPVHLTCSIGSRATVCAFPYTGSSQATMMKPVQSRTLQRQGKSGTTQTSVCGPGRTSCGLVPVTDLQLSADPTSLRPARDKTAACSIGSIWVAARKLWASTGDGVICRINLKCVYMFEEASRPRVKEHFGHVSTSMSHTPTPITKVASRILLEPGSQHIVRKHAHSCGTGSGHNPMAK